MKNVTQTRMKLHKEINTHSESEVHENSVDGWLAVV